MLIVRGLIEESLYFERVVFRVIRTSMMKQWQSLHANWNVNLPVIGWYNIPWDVLLNCLWLDDNR